MHGSFNVGSRIEWAAALIATVIRTSQGQKAKMEDFMPHAQRSEDIDNPDIGDVFKLLTGVSRNGS